MTTKNKNILNPYLFFGGRAEEAIEFYKKALGAEVLMMFRFKDSPEKGMCKPGTENKIMHSRINIGGSTVLISDGQCEGRGSFEGFSLSLTVPDEAESKRVFGLLADGGKITMPLNKTFFSPSFGMVEDRFGVSWMVYVGPTEG